MNHATAEEQGLAELYVTGRLSAAVRDEFEEHFVDCPRCLERIEWTEDFHAALRRAAAEETARTTAGGLAAALLRRRPWFIASAVAVLPVVLAAAVLWPRMSELEERSRRAEEALNEVTAELARPRTGTPIVILTRTRAVAEEVVEVSLYERQRLTYEVDPAAPFAGYRARLTDAAGTTLWQGELMPNPWAVLEITLPAGFFAPGDYRLELLGLAEDGSASEFAAFRLRAAP